MLKSDDLTPMSEARRLPSPERHMTITPLDMRQQKVADDMRENALQEAARIVREAEGRADLLLQKTQARTEDIERQIDGLRIKRREAETNVEATIAALHNTLDFIREQDRREREDRVVQH